MKKLSLLTLLSFTIVSLVSAQTNTFPSSGNVGIGISTPLKPLEVSLTPNNYVTIASLMPPGAFTGIHFGYFEPNNLNYRKTALVFERLDDAARGKIHILNNGELNSNSATLNDAKLTINYDGKVGINNTNPTAELDVNGHLVVGGQYYNPQGFHKSIALQSEYHSIFRIKGGQAQAGFWADQTVPSPRVRLGTYSNDDLGFFTNAALRLFVGADGNVGIGTLTPKEMLSVNGKIRAQEIKVETVNWPDYVFSKNYKLSSLAETEQYIKEKGHLPGIPIAKEAETNGIELGEMNKMLLQKIEELTLHLIDKDKEIGILKKETHSLKKENQDIKIKLDQIINLLKTKNK